MSSEFEFRIAAVGKIKDWSVTVKKDKLVFAGLELSPGQLEQFARLIQTKLKGEVRCTIKPVAKRLGLKPIVSSVKIDGCDIRRKGVLPAISGFTVPADRGETIVRFIREETQLTVTFDVIQGSLAFDEEESATDGTETTASNGAGEEFNEDEPPRSIPVRIKCVGMKQAELNADISFDGNYLLSYEIRLGNYCDRQSSTGSELYGSPHQALCQLKLKINMWFGELQFLGSADQKRAMARRRDAMREQVNSRLDALIDEYRKSIEPPVAAVA